MNFQQALDLVHDIREDTPFMNVKVSQAYYSSRGEQYAFIAVYPLELTSATYPCICTINSPRDWEYLIHFLVTVQPFLSCYDIDTYYFKKKGVMK